MSDPNLSSLIWSVADLLRGDYKQSDYVRQHALDVMYLVGGDVDSLPLVTATMRAGIPVHLAAFSSGLASRLRHSADTFTLLDGVYFTD